MYQAKPYLNKYSVLALYFSYIHSYINYGYLVWGSTRRTYLRKISSQQKHLLRLIHNKNRFYHSKELFESCQIINAYKLNLLNTSIFMRKIKTRSPASSFLLNFEQTSHSYPARFSSENYGKPRIKLCKCRFRCFIRAPVIWNNLVKNTEKIQSRSLFKTKMKSKLLNLENKVSFLMLLPLRNSLTDLSTDGNNV